MELLGTVRHGKHGQLRFPILRFGLRVVPCLDKAATLEHSRVESRIVASHWCHVLDCTDVAGRTEQKHVLVKRFQQRVLKLLGRFVELCHGYHLVVQFHVAYSREQTLEVSDKHLSVVSVYKHHISSCLRCPLVCVGL